MKGLEGLVDETIAVILDICPCGVIDTRDELTAGGADKGCFLGNSGCLAANQAIH
jgi:hypothetical protein